MTHYEAICRTHQSAKQPAKVFTDDFNGLRNSVLELIERLELAMRQELLPERFGPVIGALSRLYPELASAFALAYGLGAWDATCAIDPEAANEPMGVWFEKLCSNHHAVCAVREKFLMGWVTQ